MTGVVGVGGEKTRERDEEGGRGVREGTKSMEGRGGRS